MSVRFYDLRSRRVASRPKVKMAGAGPVLHPPGSIEGVVLHQTAVRFATPKGGGEPELAARALNVACHAMSFDGFYVAAAPISWYVQHANLFNSRAVGIEIDGHYGGLADKHDPSLTEWTTQRRDTAREALGWLVRQARAEGHPCTKLWAHRQSSSNRRGDPGEQIWRDVGRWAEGALGLTVDLDLVLPASNPKDGPGYAIPREWDERATARY